MIGMRRLDNIQMLVEDVLRTGTRGDLIETGVWRGGATIFMRGILKGYSITDCTVWVADSFAGFPSTEAQGASARSFSSPELAPLRGYQRRNPAGERTAQGRPGFRGHPRMRRCGGPSPATAFWTTK